MTTHHQNHTSPDKKSGDLQPPTRKEVNQIVFRFILFLGLSIWLLILSLTNGFSNADIYPDYRGRGMSSPLPFLVFPVVVTVLLGVELVRFYFRFRRASLQFSSNDDIKNEP